jgi:membrane-associated phospholipid phosphatase
MRTRGRSAVPDLLGLVFLFIFLGLVSPASAQSATSAADDPPAPAGQPAAPEQFPAPLPGLSTLFNAAIGDFKRLPTVQSAAWAAIGGAASLVSHAEDASVSTALSSGGSFHSSFFDTGNLLGSVPIQMGGAMAAYALGRAAHNRRAAEAGIDLLRAQMLAQATTFAIKYTINRTRPDGERYSFPSGHASIAFASAAVLERHFGWKAGIPAYAAASYVAAARIENQRHYLSDVVFGAALGILSARTVTVGRGTARFGVMPFAAPSGGGVALTLVGRDPAAK